MKILVDRQSFDDAGQSTIPQLLDQLKTLNDTQVVNRMSASVTHLLVANVNGYGTDDNKKSRYSEVLQSQRKDIQLLDAKAVQKLVEDYKQANGGDTAVAEEPQIRRSNRQKRRVNYEDDDPVKLDDQQPVTAKKKTKKSPAEPVVDESVGNGNAAQVVAAADVAASPPPTKPPVIKREIRKGRAAVDSECPIANRVHVYEEEGTGTIYDATLNQTNISANNNKFYLIQLLQSDSGGKEYYVWFRWGRVGVVGQSKLETYGGNVSSAKNSFESKFRSKTLNLWSQRDQFQHYPGKYDLLERDYGGDDEDGEDEEEDKGKSLIKSSSGKQIKPPASDLPSPVQQLIQLIFDLNMMRQAMVEIGYDAERMPLGKLTRGHIQKGYAVLQEIATLLNSTVKPPTQKLSELCSRFYTIIPHDFGFRHPPLIRTKQELKQKLEMVESLAEIQIASNLMQAMANNSASTACHPVDSYYLTLRNEIRPIHQQSPEYQLIERYVDATHGPTHRMRVHIRQVYGVQRHGEQERFHPVANRLKNRMLLWHGSRLSNWVGILSQGLRIAPPEAPVTGYMFGKGIYFADMVTKSANYCCTNGSNRRALLVLCEVALGRVREYLNSCYDASQPCTGPNSTADSTKGLGKNVPDQQEWQHMADGQVVVPCGKPVTTNLNGALLYNEYIVYSTDQCCMRYLVEVDILHQ